MEQNSEKEIDSLDFYRDENSNKQMQEFVQDSEKIINSFDANQENEQSERQSNEIAVSLRTLDNSMIHSLTNIQINRLTPIQSLLQHIQRMVGKKLITELNFKSLTGQRLDQQSEIDSGAEIIIENLEVKVRSQSNHYALALSPFETVNSLNSRVKEMSPVGKNQNKLILSFKGRRLHDSNQKMLELGLNNGDTLFIEEVADEYAEEIKEEKIRIQSNNKSQISADDTIAVKIYIQENQNNDCEQVYDFQITLSDSVTASKCQIASMLGFSESEIILQLENGITIEPQLNSHEDKWSGYNLTQGEAIFVELFTVKIKTAVTGSTVDVTISRDAGISTLKRAIQSQFTPKSKLKFTNRFLADTDTIRQLQINHKDEIEIVEDDNNCTNVNESYPLNRLQKLNAPVPPMVSAQPAPVHTGPSKEGNTFLGTLCCFILSVSLIIIILIPVIILYPKPKDPEYNVLVLDDLCGSGERTYFTFGAYKYQRWPTYSEIIAKLPAGYEKEQVYTTNRVYNDKEWIIYGYTSKTKIVMNKLKENSSYQMFYYCTNSHQSAALKRVKSYKFNVKPNGGVSIMAIVRSTQLLTTQMMSVITCVIADELGIERNRVYSQDGTYCYMLDPSFKIGQPLVAEKTRILSGTGPVIEGEGQEQYYGYDDLTYSDLYGDENKLQSIDQTHRRSTDELVYNIIIEKDYALFQDSSYKAIKNIVLYSEKFQDGVNQQVHELFYQKRFDLMFFDLKLLLDSYFLGSASSNGGSSVTVSSISVAQDTVDIIFTSPAPDNFYVRIDSNPITASTTLFNWPDNVLIFSKIATGTEKLSLNKLSGSTEYALLYGEITSGLGISSFRTCPEGCVEGKCDLSTGICSQCSPDLSLNNGMCCHFSCKFCKGSGPTNCLTCSQNYKIVDPFTGRCDCKDGFYLGIDNQCHACFTDCLKCTSPDKRDCTRCSNQENRALIDGVCGCKDGYFDVNLPLPHFLKSQDSVQCIKCNDYCKSCSKTAEFCTSCYSSDYRILDAYLDQCVCQAGYYELPGIALCAQCNAPCSACQNNPNTCTACIDPMRRPLSGKCVCDFGTYENAEQKCVPCHFSCRECYGPSLEQCITCYPFRQPEYLTSIVTPQSKIDLVKCHCNQVTSYPDDKEECKKCHFSCGTCTAGAKTDCTTCSAKREKVTLLDTTTVCLCSPGYFAQKEDCLSCDKTCMTCSGARKDQCTTCKEKRIFQGGKCVCNSKFFVENQSLECIVQN